MSMSPWLVWTTKPKTRQQLLLGLNGLLGAAVALFGIYRYAPPSPDISGQLDLHPTSAQGLGTDSISLGPIIPPDMDPLNFLLRNSIADTADRQILAFRDSGSSAPLLVVTYLHPDYLRKGDEAELTVRARCLNCTDKEIRIEVASAGLKIVPQDPTPIGITADVDVSRQFLISSETTGLKSLFVTTATAPSRRSVDPFVGKITVLPPLGVFGIPEPYVEFVLRSFSAIGFSSLIIYIVTLLRSRKETPAS